MDFRGKTVLIAGGTGLIGRHLARFFLYAGARVCTASLDDETKAMPNTTHNQCDLRDRATCEEVCKKIDYVCNLLCIKGSPKTAKEQPARLFADNVLLEVQLLRAAANAGVSGYLHVSSLGAYPPAEEWSENNMWNGFPSQNDWFPGWAKRVGELYVDACRIEYPNINISLVRPANVYGPHDDFDSDRSMVIPSLIRRMVAKENPLVLWGDGSQLRDFIYTTDVARAMLLIAESGRTDPINIGSGVGVSVRSLASIVADATQFKGDIIWDKEMPSGDKKRILNSSKISQMGFSPNVSLSQGIKKTVNYYKSIKNIA